MPEGFSRRSEDSISQIKQDKSNIRALLKLQSGLERTPRWREEGEFPHLTPEQMKEYRQSVLEHMAGMNSIATFLFDIAEQEGDTAISNLNFRLVSKYIILHDSEEIYTGDKREKTPEDHELEKEAVDKIVAEGQETSIAPQIRFLMESYHTKATPEARFVKAIDELEAYFHMIGIRGIDRSKRTNLRETASYQYAQEFPTLARYMKIAVDVMEKKELLSTEIPQMPTELED